jgi:group I intron endonuclease
VKYIVYKHITPCGKIYIGQTNGTIAKRAGKGGVLYKQCPYFYKAIQKYGWDNIEHIIVSDNLSKKEADYLEKYLISYYNTTDSSHGYNLTKGGDGVEGRTVSEETRAKIKNAQKGRHNSVETEFKKGHTFTPEVLAKISKANKGKQMSAETRARMSRAKKGKMYNMRQIEAYKKGEKIGVYKSIAEASEVLGINTSTIHRSLNGTTGQKALYKFYYITA